MGSRPSGPGARGPLLDLGGVTHTAARTRALWVAAATVALVVAAGLWTSQGPLTELLPSASSVVVDDVDWDALEARAWASERCRERHTHQNTAGPPLLPGFATHWIVAAADSLPAHATEALLRQSGWNLVLVGTDNDDGDVPAACAAQAPRCVFLGREAQRALGYRTFAHADAASALNVGRMYAVAHGATTVYEPADGTVLADAQITLLAGTPRARLLVSAPEVDRRGVFNVFGHFGQPRAWPRGFPLSAIADKPLSADPPKTVLAAAGDTVVGIEQALVNGTRAVDAVFRLARTALHDAASEVVFASADEAPPLVLPAFVFSPINALNTVYHHAALWSTLTFDAASCAPPCAQDVWRGYWTQRLLWDAGAQVLFRAPNAQRVDDGRHGKDRTDYEDFLDEFQLYRDAGRLVAFLRDWRAPAGAGHLFARADALTRDMVHAGFWSENTVVVVRDWLLDLLDVCYVPPRPGAAQQAVIPAFAAGAAAVLASPPPPPPNPAGTASPVALASPTSTPPAAGAAAPTPASTAGLTLPTYLWDDVVMYMITFPGRHLMMRIVRHTWGRLVPRLVIFTSGVDDPSVPTVFLPNPHPGWQEQDRRQSVYVNEVVPRLLELEPPAKFFINLDDDTMPILPNIHQWLERYKARNNGSYPYYVLHTLPLGFVNNTDYAEQATAARELFTKKSMGHFPVGHMYAYSRELLQELLPVYRSCPVMRPGDVNFGALVFCSRVNMTAAEVDSRRKRTVVSGFVKSYRSPTAETFDPTVPIDSPNITFYLHNVRPQTKLLRSYRLVYGNYYGVPEDPIVERLMQDGS